MNSLKTIHNSSKTILDSIGRVGLISKAKKINNANCEKH